jgi:transcriptional regulator with XRE-family HTH domain
LDEKTIGSKIRDLRRRAGFTLAAVAKRAGLTKGTLSKIELGSISPPVSTLMRIADGMGVRLADFLDEPTENPPFVLTRKGEGEIMQRDGSRFGYAYQALAARMHRKWVEPFLLTVKPGDPAGHFHHGGQEFIYMLSGALDITVGAARLVLRAGDSLYFDPTLAHITRARGSKPATFLCIFVQEPALPRPWEK